MPQVEISLKDLYKELCPKCKKKVEDMILEQVGRQQVKRALKGGEGGRPT